MTQPRWRANALFFGLFALLGLLAALARPQVAAADPVSLDEAGATPKATTPGGCTVAPEGADAAWRLTLPSGQSFRVALDGAAVKVTTPAGETWRLPGSTSFILPDGAKVTLGMRMDRQRGLVPEHLHIAHGDHDVVISGLSKGAFKASASDARADNDGRFADGDYVVVDADAHLFWLPAADVAAAKAGKALAAPIHAGAEGQLEAKPSAEPLPLPPAALPLLIEPEPEP